MPSERSPFWSPVEPISPPPKPARRVSGLGWRRRVLPPGPKDLLRCPFIAIAARADGKIHIGVRARGGKGLLGLNSRQFTYTLRAIVKAKSKFSQAGPNWPKPGQIFPRKKAWISLDSLVRNEPFQGVALTTGQKIFFSLHPP